MSKSRHTSSSSTPTHGPKLPKFLQSKQSRDRSKSMIEATPSTSNSIASSSSSSSNLSQELLSSSSLTATPKHLRSSFRRNNKLGVDDRASSQVDEFGMVDDTMDEPPVIVEPVSPRLRPRTERPLSTASDHPSSLSYYQPSHSSSRLSDFPTRLSGWFSHTFNTSSNDLTLPSLLSSTNSLPPTGSSPKGKASSLLSAARHGKGHLDKAMRYLLDSDATPDKCPDPIWLLGMQHSGYESPPPLPLQLPLSSSPVAVPTPSTPPQTQLSRRGSNDSRKTPSFRSSTSSTVTSSTTSPNMTLSRSSSPQHPANNWPPVFYSDFTSRIWVTYRSHFAPIRDSTLSALENEQADVAAGMPVTSSPPPKRWNWPGSGEKGWTSDAGWGCMLRTGQSLLANALLHLHLGRGK
jgi:cysteine protease ATG4